MKRFILGFCLTTAMQWGLAQSRELPDFSELVDRHSASVVNVSTTQLVKVDGAGSFPNRNDPFFDMFRQFFPQMPGGAPREYVNRSLATGFIISGDGYILTNAHVVDAADEIVVKLNDKREFKARVIGADRLTDVALLKIQAANLPSVTIGAPDKVRVGEWVMAIGTPWGLEHSVTAGIISAKGRFLPGPDNGSSFVPYLQTDVAINAGNSGGPLFNMKGEVIGINSWMYSKSGGNIGLGFAIPIDMAMEVQQQLRLNGKITRGRIGIALQDMSAEMAESFGLPKPTGALVRLVEKDGPAEKAGVVMGDIILNFDGRTIAETDDLARLVVATKPGSKVVMQVWRGGSRRDLSVTVGEMPTETQSSKSSPGQGGGDGARVDRLGLALSELTAEQLNRIGIKHGLLVRGVSSSGPGSELMPGDVIRSIVVKGRQVELSSVEQFRSQLAKFSAGETVTLLVRRGRTDAFITQKLPVAKAPRSSEVN